MTRRVQQLESQLAKEQERYAQASRAAGEQVVHVYMKAHVPIHICLVYVVFPGIVC